MHPCRHIYCDKLDLPALFVRSSFLYQQRLSECTERDWVRLVEIYDRPDGINSSKLILFFHSFSSSPRTCRPSANILLLSLDTLNHQTICINIFMILCEKTLFVVNHVSKLPAPLLWITWFLFNMPVRSLIYSRFQLNHPRSLAKLICFSQSRITPVSAVALELKPRLNSLQSRITPAPAPSVALEL